VAFHILVAKHPTRVDRLQYPGEVVESRIQFTKFLRTKVMCLGPMRPAAVTAQDGFETLEQQLVWDLEPVGSSASLSQCRNDKARHVLELDNPDPTSLLSVAGTQPNVVTVGESYFDREVRAETIGVRKLAL
jgi:hypothetical protein